MTNEDGKTIVGRWREFNPAVIDELAAPKNRFEYSSWPPGRTSARPVAVETKSDASQPSSVRRFPTAPSREARMKVARARDGCEAKSPS